MITRYAGLLITRMPWTYALVTRPSTLCVGIFAYVCWRVIHARWLSPLRNVPGPFYSRISSLPSRARGLFSSTNDDMIRGAQKYGPLYMMEPTKVAVCDPEDCRIMLASYKFAKNKLYSNVGFMDPNIFLTRDEDLNKQRRRQIGPALSPTGLRDMEHTILAAGPQQLLAKWDERLDASGGPPGEQAVKLCYFHDFTLMSFDIIASLGFGQKHRSLTTQDTKVAQWVEKTFTMMILQMVLPVVKLWPFRVVVDMLLGRHVRELFRFGHAAIQQRKVHLQKGLPKPDDVLQKFIDAEDPEEEGIRMTSRQVITETIMMLISGADTSSTALAWTIHLLLLYPQHLRQATEQVRQNFALDHLITYEEARRRVPFLEACILESLRLCPVSTNLPRIVPPGGVVLSGHYIPEGYTVTACTAAANQNPSKWPDPQRFDPGRFAPSNPNVEANRRNLMTMSSGVRICPGRYLVMLEMMVTLANILNRYDLSLPADARYTPDNLTAQGLPEIMPRTNLVAMVPKYPSRDCNVVISKRKNIS
ncbi:hypothetical protein IWW36_002374 [Coemansia brasiliensis]|uniref:Cytochrome P450 n=1 Tax=Coemansia brasiliensis TaxID=2650707 RepID=A0A9W8I832_9FUNG|nr:hypothetical protein IWW36_002374 [Coemansia brasiliensis]